MLRRQASTLQERSRELMESYRRLEESSLEAIAGLNATVDAKDPYTAGHSARVQRIALAVAEELGVPAQRLDAVRFGGLFHDIGKIAVPGQPVAQSRSARRRGVRGRATPSGRRRSPRSGGSSRCSSRTSRIRSPPLRKLRRC
jgi:putative nucleotidyltransferase with HDIG domain